MNNGPNITENTLNIIESAAEHTKNIIENAIEKTSNIIENATEHTLNIIKKASEQASNATETASDEVYLQNEAMSLVNIAKNYKERKTAIHIAAMMGDIPLLDYLIKNNPNELFKKDRFRCTPLHLAALNGHDKTVARLVELGIDVNAKSFGNMTAFHFAALSGSDKTIALLAKLGIKINARASADMTALHFAAQEGHDKTIVLLAELGIDVNAKTERGLTALDCAVQGGHTKTVALLSKLRLTENNDLKFSNTLLLKFPGLRLDDLGKKLWDSFQMQTALFHTLAHYEKHLNGAIPFELVQKIAYFTNAKNEAPALTDAQQDENNKSLKRLYNRWRR